MSFTIIIMPVLVLTVKKKTFKQKTWELDDEMLVPEASRNQIKEANSIG